ncbi:hypothetical protein BHF69_08460 [Anaerostipes sp. 992a]|uniref:leucine-rich repeat protein n=1 Tax=Anaerostipes sp. 992a TaxID=1261637 RepID=UPI0009518917|nr:leucine-rich repeat protein [Anaerostipes sp. 992a]OLR62706.1 hypothetical protein BHF69_08460 [Anaerostipes sp. 992a]
MKRHKKRILAVLLSIMMIIGSVPVEVYAAKDQTTVKTETEEKENSAIDGVIDSVKKAVDGVMDDGEEGAEAQEDSSDATENKEEITETNKTVKSDTGATTEESGNLIYGTDGIITRAEWLHDLTVVFGMTVEEDNYPDNYFSDLKEDHTYYKDILLAIQFGVVDIEEGDPIHPDDPVTRDFAVKTLNFCLGFQLDEGTEYTFSDSADCSSPDDAQISVNRQWIKLVDGRFSPETNITSEEVQTMLSDVQKVLEADVVDESYDSQYDLADGVVEVPDGTIVSVDEENRVTITDCPVTIESGTQFVVYQNGIANAYTAESVTKDGNTITIVTKDTDNEDAFAAVDAQGVVEADLMDIQPAEGVEVTYSNEETGETYSSARVAERKITEKQYKSAHFTKTVNLGSGVSVDVKVDITNPKVYYEFSTLKQKAYLKFTSDAQITYMGKGNITEALGSQTVTIANWGIQGVGGIDINADFDLSGSISGTQKAYIETGFSLNKKDGLRILQSFQAKLYSISIEANGQAGINIKAGLTKPSFAKAYVYAKAGGIAKLEADQYFDDQTPEKCVQFTAYLYASYGAYASCSWIDETYEKKVVIYDGTNSPINIDHHYEDGKKVGFCSRGKSYKYLTSGYSQYAGSGWGSGSGDGYDAEGNPITIYKYSLSEDGNATITKYSGNARALIIPSQLDGHKVVALGNESFASNTLLQSVIIPNGITSIGSSVFSRCSNLQSIEIPDTVTTIGDAAFENTGLVSLALPKNLTSMGREILSGNTGVTEITIPKTVTSMQGGGFKEGSFRGSNIEKAVIEEGMTELPDYAFDGATALKSVEIPDTVTRIGAVAFKDCTALNNINIPDSVTAIGDAAFENTGLVSLALPKNLTSMGREILSGNTGVTEITIPKTATSMQGGGFKEGSFRGSNIEKAVIEEGMTKLPDYAFDGATALKSVEIPDTVTRIGAVAFQDCTALSNINIPDSVTAIGDAAFENTGLVSLTLPKNLTSMGREILSGNTGVTEITIPKTATSMQGGGFKEGSFRGSNIEKAVIEEGMTELPDYAFDGATALKSVEIPDTVTRIGAVAFQDCTVLSNINIPDSITAIGDNVFRNTGLTRIEIPNSVTQIGNNTFYDCKNLSYVKLPDTRATITNSMFYNCTSLEIIALPDTITNINDSAFENSGLKSITIPEKVTSVGNNAFKNSPLESVEFKDSNATIGESAFNNCVSLSNVVLGKNIKTLGKYAFYGCDALAKIEIPNSVTSIGTYIFQHCDTLADVTLGNGITSIPSYAFDQCAKLEKITVPYRVTTIKDHAFSNSVEFKEIIIPRAVTSIDSTAFSYLDKLTIYGIAGTYAETFANDHGIKFVNQEVKATEVTLNKTELTLNKGQKDKLIMSVTPSNFTDEVSWKSSNTDIITIDDTGLVTAKALGTATIKLIVGDVNTSCKVTVVQPVTSISLNKTSLSMEALDTYQLTATANPSEAANKEVEWSSSNEEVATIDQNGMVRALGKGTAEIKVSAKDGSGVSNKCTVTVSNTAHVAATVEEMESPHNYENNCSDFWVYTLEGAETLSIIFDERTNIEEDFDFLYIYDGNGNEIGKYTGTILAGQMITIPGDTIRIKLVSDSSGNEWGFKASSIVDPNRKPSVEVVSQPEDYTGAVGDTAVFTVEAIGEGLTYQWQFSNDKGSTWKNSSQSGNQTDTIRVPITEARNGQQYRCIVTDGEGNQAISESGTLVVSKKAEALVIATQPSDYTGAVGETATFTVKAAGNGLIYQWQFSSDKGSTWKNSSQNGNKTDTIKVPITEARNGQQYRCVVTDENGNSVTSGAASLIIGKASEGPMITGQPEDYTGAVGDTAVFIVTATGEELIYQWQYSNDKGATWKNSSQSGNKTATIKVPITEARNGQQYRCMVTDVNGNKVTSDAARLIVGTASEGPVITGQPVNYTGEVGKTATFTVTATGEELKYQWQYSNDKGATWKNSSQSGNKTATIKVPITEARNGQQYRCVVTDANGSSVTSEAAKLIVGTELTITSQPEDYIGAVGDTASFTVGANGEGLKYQWQYSNDDGTSWRNSSQSGSKTSTISVPITAARNGQQYRCVVTDERGNSVTSEAGTLRVQ